MRRKTTMCTRLRAAVSTAALFVIHFVSLFFTIAGISLQLRTKTTTMHTVWLILHAGVPLLYQILRIWKRKKRTTLAVVFSLYWIGVGIDLAHESGARFTAFAMVLAFLTLNFGFFYCGGLLNTVADTAVSVGWWLADTMRLYRTRNIMEDSDSDSEDDDDDDEEDDDDGISLFVLRKKKTTEKKNQSQQQQQQHSIRFLILEGSIAAGKTTLGKHLYRTRESWRQKKGGAETQAIFRSENVDPELHEKFLENPERYAHHFQMTMCWNRRKILEDAVARTRRNSLLPPPIEIIDRSLLGDYAFCAWNYIVGNFSKHDFAMYLKIHGRRPALMLKNIRDIQLSANMTLVYVFASVSTTLDRLRRRGGIDQETGYDYLTGISILHSLVFASVLSDKVLQNDRPRIHIIDNDGDAATFDDRDDLSLQSLLASKTSPRTFEIPETADATSLVLTDEQKERFQQVVSTLFESSRSTLKKYAQSGALLETLPSEKECLELLVKEWHHQQ